MTNCKPEEASFKDNYHLFADYRSRREATGVGEDMAHHVVDRSDIVFRDSEHSEAAFFGTEIEKGSGYHVRSTYTLIEEPLVFRSAALLAQIASGTAKEISESLADRIVRYFSSQNKEQLSFSRAVSDAILECLDAFGKKYPSMLPALHALYTNSGSQGTQLSVDYSKDFLRDAIDTKLSEENVGEYGMPPLQEFAGAHPPLIPGEPKDPPREYEIQCAGMRFAKEILRQAAVAALRISEDAKMIEGYRHGDGVDAELFNVIKTRDASLQKVVDLFTAAEKQYLSD